MWLAAELAHGRHSGAVVQVHCAAGWVAVLLLVPCFCLFLLCLLPWMQPVEPVVK